MKFKLLVLACSSLFTFGVYAQTQTSPAPGKDKLPKVDTAACEKAAKSIRPKGVECLKIKAQNKRSQCFDKIGKSVPNGCDQLLEPLKQEFMAKEKQAYPTQASSMEGGSTQGNMPGTANQGSMPGTANQGSMPGTANQGSMPGNMPKVDPAVCEKMAKKIRPQAEACLKTKNQVKRSQCFDKIGQESNKNGVNGSCDQILEPMKQEFMSKEKQMYPSQATALGGQGQSQTGTMQGQPATMQGQPGNMQGQPGNMQGQPGNMQGQPATMQGQGNQPKSKIDPAVCDKLSKTIRPKGEACLKMKEQAKRSQCFDKIGNEIEKAASNGACEQQLEPLKQELMSKEKQMYPTQESGLK